ncbi:hypothetical protein [Nitratifractor sp.]
MRRISYCRELPSIEREIFPELQHFFARVREVRRRLGTSPYLNRIQRQRCRSNLLELERLEREFHAVEYREDYYHLHRKLRRYLYLDSRGLAHVLGEERIKECTLFLL